MWSVKFARLCYLAFLDCELLIKDALYLTAGALITLGIFALVPFIGELSLASAMVIFNVTEAVFVFVVFAFQIAISVVYCESFLRVAYEYDNRSWGVITTIKTIEENLSKQYETDKRDAKIKRDAHLASMRNEIEQLKKKKN